MRLLLAILLISVMAPPALAQDSADYDADLTAALIQRLGDASYSIREQANQELLQHGHAHPDDVIDAIVDAYRQEDDPEVRLRLKDILQLLVTEHLFNPETGYLGIILRPLVRPVRLGDRVLHPLKVRLILDNPSTELGDLAVGDLMVRVDDLWFERSFTYADLNHYIRSRSPGTTITFMVLKDGQLQARKVVVGKQPTQPDELELQAMRQQFFRRWMRAALRDDRDVGTEPATAR